MKKALFILACLATLTACNNQRGEQYRENSSSTEFFPTQNDDDHYQEPVKAKQSASSFVGTYKFQDYRGQKWKLVLKDDKTAIISLNGEIIDYGTWDNFPYHFPLVEFAFDWDNDYRLYLENSDDNYFHLYLNNGYVYCGPQEAKANHPKKRLKYNKN